MYLASILPILGQLGAQNVRRKVAFTRTFILFMVWFSCMLHLPSILPLLGQPPDGARITS